MENTRKSQNLRSLLQQLNKVVLILEQEYFRHCHEKSISSLSEVSVGIFCRATPYTLDGYTLYCKWLHHPGKRV